MEYISDDRFNIAGCESNYILAHYQSPRNILCLWEKLQKDHEPECCEWRNTITQSLLWWIYAYPASNQTTIYIFNQSSRRLICFFSLIQLIDLFITLICCSHICCVVVDAILYNQIVVLENFVQVEAGFCDFYNVRPTSCIH